MSGITDSIDLPTTEATQPSFGGGGQDAFVAKLDPSGSRLVYLTYLGGDAPDTTTGVAVDSAGNAYVTGFTRSRNFPSLNGFERGAVIVLNGEGQNTKYQSGTSLKGKKVAKKIPAGQPVRLQVRNPDGLTSAELNFTRP